jgi:hypothetical protein
LQSKLALIFRMQNYMKRLMAQGIICQYVGVGVRLGDATKVVCVTGKPGDDTARAVFGDLSVRDIRTGSEEFKAIIREYQQRMRQVEAQLERQKPAE